MLFIVQGGIVLAMPLMITNVYLLQTTDSNTKTDEGKLPVAYILLNTYYKNILKRDALGTQAFRD